MDTIVQAAAATALRHMLNARHFDICTIDAIAAAAHVVTEPDSYKTLRLLHCIDYAEMPPVVRAELPILISQCLSGLQIDATFVDRLFNQNPAPGHVVVVEDEPRGVRKLLSLFSR